MINKLMISLVAGTVSLSTLSLAVPTESRTKTAKTRGSWDHNENRNIAFASAIMGTLGADVDTWKAVTATQFCAYPGPLPEPIEPAEPQPTDPSLPPEPETDREEVDEIETVSDCAREVYYTTHYELVECPNGMAYIARSGEGLTLSSNTDGTLFSWAEDSGCYNGDVIVIGRDGQSRSDRKRQLEFSKIVKN